MERTQLNQVSFNRANLRWSLL